MLTNCIIIGEACNRLTNHVFTAPCCSGLAGRVKKLQEKHSGVKILSGVFCNWNHSAIHTRMGYEKVELKWRKRNVISSFGTRDLYFKATSKQGDWWQEEILPISTGVNPLRSHILWRANFIEKRENEKEPFLHYTLARTEVPYSMCLFSICCKRAALWNNLAD